MGDVVNLRAVRKRRDRQAREASAAENRALHGRTGSEKKRDRAEADALARHVDRHRLDPAPEGGAPKRS